MNTLKMLVILFVITGAVLSHAATKQWSYSENFDCGGIKSIVADGKRGCAAIIGDYEKIVVVWLNKKRCHTVSAGTPRLLLQYNAHDPECYRKKFGLFVLRLGKRKGLYCCVPPPVTWTRVWVMLQVV